MTEPTNDPDPRAKDAELMARYGIQRVPTERFHYKAYRYSTLADALAQARRDERTA
jgi:hypothetical protein